MAHEIEKAVAVYSVQDGAAWHKIGTPIEVTGSIIDHLRAVIQAQPLLAAEYGLVPLTVANYGEHPTQSAVVRFDDAKICGGVVGSTSYSLSQPKDQWDLAGRILRDIPDVRLSFAAMLADGARMLQTWNLGDFDIAGEAHKRFLAVHTGFDGSYSTEVILSAIRAVCNNTVSAARYDSRGSANDDAESQASQAKGYERIKRTSKAAERETKAVSHMRSIFEAFGKLKTWSEALTPSITKEW